MLQKYLKYAAVLDGKNVFTFPYIFWQHLKGVVLSGFLHIAWHNVLSFQTKCNVSEMGHENIHNVLLGYIHQICHTCIIFR